MDGKERWRFSREAAFFWLGVRRLRGRAVELCDWILRVVLYGKKIPGPDLLLSALFLESVQDQLDDGPVKLERG